MGFKEYTPEQQAKILAEAKDDKYVMPSCPLHNYVGAASQVPVFGCKQCAEVDWWKRLANIPPHKRQETVEMLYALLRKMNELVEARQFDLKVKAPSIKVTQGAA